MADRMKELVVVLEDEYDAWPEWLRIRHFYPNSQTALDAIEQAVRTWLQTPSGQAALADIAEHGAPQGTMRWQDITDWWHAIPHPPEIVEFVIETDDLLLVNARGNILSPDEEAAR